MRKWVVTYDNPEDENCDSIMEYGMHSLNQTALENIDRYGWGAPEVKKYILHELGNLKRYVNEQLRNGRILEYHEDQIIEVLENLVKELLEEQDRDDIIYPY